MTAGNDFDPTLDQPTLFSARVTPHRSLNRTGFTVLMAFVGVVSFVAGIAFYLMGAWPVLGFFGLDVLLIYPGQFHGDLERLILFGDNKGEIKKVCITRKLNWPRQ